MAFRDICFAVLGLIGTWSFKLLTDVGTKFVASRTWNDYSSVWGNLTSVGVTSNLNLNSSAKPCFIVLESHTPPNNASRTVREHFEGIFHGWFQKS